MAKYRKKCAKTGKKKTGKGYRKISINWGKLKFAETREKNWRRMAKNCKEEK